MILRCMLRAAVAPFMAMFAVPAVAARAADFPPGLYARIDTTKGVMWCWLEFEKTPMTVTNFVGLAEGRFPVDYGPSLARVGNNFRAMKAEKDRELAQARRGGNAQAIADAQATVKIYEGYDDRVKQLAPTGQPYYDGIIFHRVIDDFMAQVGCPLALGLGGPGYQFPDEFHPDLRHSQAGILSMANAGPGTNGSQFFITHRPTPHLDDRHSVFGHVVEGMDVLGKIRIGDAIQSVTILRVGEAAEAFDASHRAFLALRSPAAAIASRLEAAALRAAADSSEARAIAMMRENLAAAQPDDQGVLHSILRAGAGEPIGNRKQASVHYTGYLLNGQQFDSSIPRNDPLRVMVGAGDVIRGWDITLAAMRVGEKRAIFLPSDLAYGPRAMGPIPSNAILYFEMELLSAE